MRDLHFNEISSISGAGTGKLSLTDIVSMLESGMSGSQIASVGLKTATEEVKPSWGNNVAGDSGYYLTDIGGPIAKVTRWFFDGSGYAVS